VGGGYPTRDLSNFSLDWMIGHLRDCGVAISPQYKPTDAFTFGPIHTPYRDPPFDLRPHAPRQLPENALFHPSVQRYLAQFKAYQPPDSLAPWLTGRQLSAQAVKA
jgi:glutathione S-transferase